MWQIQRLILGTLEDPELSFHVPQAIIRSLTGQKWHMQYCCILSLMLRSILWYSRLWVLCIACHALANMHTKAETVAVSVRRNIDMQACLPKASQTDEGFICVLRQLFDALVLPTVSYGAEIWGTFCSHPLPADIKQMADVQLSCLQQLFHWKKSVTPAIIF